MSENSHSENSNVSDRSMLVPRDMRKLANGNLYKNVLVCMKRARQIELERYDDCISKLSDWGNYMNEFTTNSGAEAQCKISQFFENQKKPECVAIDEFEDNKLVVTEKEEEIQE